MSGNMSNSFEPHKSSQQLVSLAVSFEPSPVESLRGSDRATIFHTLIQMNQDKKDTLVNWLREHKARDKVKSISDVNVFDMIHVYTSPESVLTLRRLLRRAPGIASVEVDTDLTLDLIE
ncbi:MAG: hypothetical protein SF123_15900 [Chloroflexota bacterium]|nr:hypothetical protein [Chloroflexota bacterium]